MTPTPTEVEELAEEVRLAKLLAYTDTATWILTRFVRREKHERVVAHIESSHNEVVCSSTLRHADDGGDPVPLLTCMTWDSHCLRAELRGQRCDGSGTLFGLANKGTPYESPRLAMCKGCPACKPTDCVCGGNPHIECDAHTKPTDDGGQPTPKGDECSWCKHPRERHGAPRGWESACRSCHCERFDGGRTLESVSEAVESTRDRAPSKVPDVPAAPVPIVTPESMSLLEHHCSDADFATIGKLRDESYAAGYSAGRDDAARLNVQQVSHVVELGPETLRAVVAAIMSCTERSARYSDVDLADELLTHLHEREMK